MRKERIFRCIKRRFFSACSKRGYFIVPRGDVLGHAQRDDISLRQEEMLHSNTKLSYFIAPRGDASVHAQREDISLRQEEMYLSMRKERIFHCAKMRSIWSCAKIGLRQDMFLCMRKERKSLRSLTTTGQLSLLLVGKTISFSLF